VLTRRRRLAEPSDCARFFPIGTQKATRLPTNRRVHHVALQRIVAVLRRASPATIALGVSAALAMAACAPAVEHPGNPGSGAAPAAAPPSEVVAPAPAKQDPTPEAEPAGGVSAEPRPDATVKACPAENRWGTAPRGGSTAMTPAPLYLVRAGRHSCYDRVVFDLNGPEAVGYYVRYVPLVTADGSGEPVPVAGRAVLEVVVRGPVLGADNRGHQPLAGPPALGADFVAPARLAGWASLTQVAFAGSFEGQTTVAVGVRDRRPFRVWTSGDRGYRHVIIDIAH
jgi:hypothetical protein